MDNIRIVRKYMEWLEKGDMQNIVALFSENGTVDSPLYGVKKASEFYKILSADTADSKLKLNGIFEEKTTGRIALYFNYNWILKNNKSVNFDVVDIIEFNENGKIESLKIIYDPTQSRKLFGERSSKT